MKPTKSKFNILKQVCDYIPKYLTAKLAKKHNIQTRSFSPWSHVVAMVHCQLSHALSLNDICDTLKIQAGAIADIRDATPPSRNGLAYANQNRSAAFAEELFWLTLADLQKLEPGFGISGKYTGVPRRFKRAVYAVDSSTIRLVANCLDWGQHRRRKAAAKCHMQLDLNTFLPSMVIIKEANTYDSTEAPALCAGLKSGEIVTFDKAYVDFEHLNTLHHRGVFWVTRSKTNMAYKVTGQHAASSGAILSDEMIELTTQKSSKSYPERIRRVSAMVVIDGKQKQMEFITNNTTWSAQSIADLYQARWGIEVFFKEIKQTLQIGDFVGHSKNAIQWQLWTALLTYLLVRFIKYQSQFQGSFKRLFSVLRGCLWSRLGLYSMLEFCGTAKGKNLMLATGNGKYQAKNLWESQALDTG